MTNRANHKVAVKRNNKITPRLRVKKQRKPSYS